MKTKTPIIAIVGQTNVGKSSLFNVMIKKREAIVAREEGTTRDSLTAKLEFEDKQAWLVDTAGMKKAEDDFEATIQYQITGAIDSADIIMVVIDASGGITDTDRRLAKQALKSKKQTVLVVNKADKNHTAQDDDFVAFGIKDIILTSATTKQGVGELLDYLYDSMPKSYGIVDSTVTFALIGRPNVGKSSLFNSFAQKQQAIVSSRSGTTRDINRLNIRWHGSDLQILDTAGIRKPGKVKVGIEKFSVVRSLAAVEEADVCFLVLDANDLDITLDQRLGGMIKDAGKGMIIVINKWDTIDKDAYTRDSLAPRIVNNFDFAPWAQLVFTSAVSDQNVNKLIELGDAIVKQRAQQIATPLLNRWLKRVTLRHPPAGLKNTRPKLKYITQDKDEMTPTFYVHGTDVKFLHWSYKRHMDKEIRREYGYDGTAVVFRFRES